MNTSRLVLLVLVTACLPFVAVKTANADIIIEGKKRIGLTVLVDIGRYAEYAVQAHKIKEGETLSSIAKDYLGDGERWPEIAKRNPDIDPQALKPGKEIIIPPKSVAVEGKSDSLPCYHFFADDGIGGYSVARVVPNVSVTVRPYGVRIIAVEDAKVEEFLAVAKQKKIKIVDEYIAKNTGIIVSERLSYATQIDKSDPCASQRVTFKVVEVSEKSMKVEKSVIRYDSKGQVLAADDFGPKRAMKATLGFIALVSAIGLALALRKRMARP